MKQILIIEDEFDLRTNIKKILEISGYSVLSAANGKEGIQLAENLIPDLIICDIMMPEMDGYQVLEEVSKLDKVKDVPFIFLTAKVDVKDLRKGMELGADDYIFKPFRAKELISAIEVRLKRFKEIKSDILEGSKTLYPELQDEIDFITQKGNVRIKISEIKCLTGQEEFTRIKVKDNSDYLIKTSIFEIFQHLPEDHFIPIHETSIINLNYIEKIEKWFQNAYMIYLSGISDPFFISKRFAENLPKLI